MKNFRFNLPEKDAKQYTEGFEKLLKTGKSTSELNSLFHKIINEQLQKLDCYIACGDGTGQVYNRKTGQRFTLHPATKTNTKAAGSRNKMLGKFI